MTSALQHLASASSSTVLPVPKPPGIAALPPQRHREQAVEDALAGDQRLVARQALAHRPRRRAPARHGSSRPRAPCRCPRAAAHRRVVGVSPAATIARRRRRRSGGGRGSAALGPAAAGARRSPRPASSRSPLARCGAKAKARRARSCRAGRSASGARQRAQQPVEDVAEQRRPEADRQRLAAAAHLGARAQTRRVLVDLHDDLVARGCAPPRPAAPAARRAPTRAAGTARWRRAQHRAAIHRIRPAQIARLPLRFEVTQQPRLDRRGRRAGPRACRRARCRARSSARRAIAGVGLEAASAPPCAASLPAPPRSASGQIGACTIRQRRAGRVARAPAARALGPPPRAPRLAPAPASAARQTLPGLAEHEPRALLVREPLRVREPRLRAGDARRSSARAPRRSRRACAARAAACACGEQGPRLGRGPRRGSARLRVAVLVDQLEQRARARSSRVHASSPSWRRRRAARSRGGRPRRRGPARSAPAAQAPTRRSRGSARSAPRRAATSTTAPRASASSAATLLAAAGARTATPASRKPAALTSSPRKIGCALHRAVPAQPSRLSIRIETMRP